MRTGKGFFKRLITPRAQVAADVDAELQFHLATQVDELVEAGWTEADATAEVHRRFGDPDKIGVECKTIASQRVDRERRGDVVDAIRSDVIQTLKRLARKPGFSGLVVVILALGIGGTTAMFSVVDGVLLRPLPYPDASSLVIAWETDRASGTTREPASIPDYFDFRERNRTFEELAAFNSQPMTLTRSGESPEQLAVAQVTHTFGPVLGLVPALGRFISPEEDVPGAGQVALLSERLWRSEFGGDEAVIGGVVTLDDTPHTVVGVLAAEVEFPETPDLWIAAQIGPTSGPRSNHRHTVVGRLKDGVSVPMAQAEMDRIAAELEEEYPSDNRARGVNVEPLATVLFGDVRASLLTVLGAVGLLLLIACVNVANLLLARGARRAREVAVRTAIGASATRLSRQFLIEGVILSLAAAVLGTVVAVLATRGLLAGLPDGLPRSGQVSIDGRILAFTAALSAMVGILSGLVPALQARRVDVNTVLTREGGRAGGLSRRARL
ncbi:MAG: ABC transporter permease, partial [Longimicrobiales bacterium]